MITEETIKKITELKKQGLPNKAISRALNLDIKTVRKYLSDTSINPDIPTSIELTKKKQKLAEIKTETDILKAETEYKKQKALSELEEMELALQEDAKTQKEKEVQFKYGMLYLNSWLEESGLTERYDTDNIEDIKIFVTNSLKQDFLDASFESKEALEDFIRIYVENISNIIDKENLQRWKEEENQRKIERLQKKQDLYMLKRLGYLYTKKF